MQANSVEYIMFTINSSFIGQFKIGDNINYNLEVLAALYKAQRDVSETEQYLFNKPITITIASIAEAILCDFHSRIRSLVVEGVPSLAERVVDAIRKKQIDDFKKYVQSARKNDLLHEGNSTLYDELEELTTVRNRIHIQNKKGELHSDEIQVFTDARRIRAERTLERLMKNMMTHHARGEGMHYVQDFVIPWEERFPFNN